MGASDVPAQVLGRCAHHPGSRAIERCAACGQELCLVCAVPVRGRVLGPGCIPEDDARSEGGTVADPAERDRRMIDVAMAVVFSTTVLPWSAFGLGSGPFGAWGFTPRWASLFALAATAGLGVALWSRRTGRRAERAPDRTIAWAARVALVGSLLGLSFPPAFTSRGIGTWAAATAALAAVAAASRARRERA